MANFSIGLFYAQSMGAGVGREPGSHAPIILENSGGRVFGNLGIIRYITCVSANA